MLKLDELIRDRSLLFQALGIADNFKGESIRLACPLHGGHRASMWIGAKDGKWFWKCHTGCGEGSFIDAYMTRNRCSVGEAMRHFEAELGVKIERNSAPPPIPVLDMERTERIISYAQEQLKNDQEFVNRIGVLKRGLSLGVISKFKLGRLLRVSFDEYGPREYSGWLIPITDVENKNLALRIHQENQTDFQTPKCLWAPVGTKIYPGESKPRHKVATLYPAPEGQGDKIYLFPGELKALCGISLRLPSTSFTGGESELPHVSEIARLPKLVVLVFDAESDKPTRRGLVNPGRTWRDKMQKILIQSGRSVLTCSMDDLKKPVQKPEAIKELKEYDAEGWAAHDAKVAKMRGSEWQGPRDPRSQAFIDSMPEVKR